MLIYIYFCNINDILCVCTPTPPHPTHVWRGNKIFNHAAIIPGDYYETISFMTQISSLVTTVVVAV